MMTTIPNVTQYDSAEDKWDGFLLHRNGCFRAHSDGLVRISSACSGAENSNTDLKWGLPRGQRESSSFGPLISFGLTGKWDKTLWSETIYIWNSYTKATRATLCTPQILSTFFMWLYYIYVMKLHHFWHFLWMLNTRCTFSCYSFGSLRIFIS